MPSAYIHIPFESTYHTEKDKTVFMTKVENFLKNKI